VTRTGELSHWKGLAYPATAFGATHAAFLAMRGVTGPREVFEGNSPFARDAAWPYVIDQHPVAVVRLGGVVDALGSHAVAIGAYSPG
jgi:2-methylcitrate dehydratase